MKITTYQVTPIESGSCSLTVTDKKGNALIVAITVNSPPGTITEYGGSLSGPSGITAGPDGNLWFTENGNGKIGKITTGGSITEYGGSLSGPGWGLRVGPDGNLWFTENGNGKVGKTDDRWQASPNTVARCRVHGESRPVPTAICGSQNPATA